MLYPSPSPSPNQVSDQLGEAGAYIYVQFESRRKGYVDDMEFNLAKGARS